MKLILLNLNKSGLNTMNLTDYKYEFKGLHGTHTYDRFYETVTLLFDICAELSHRDNNYPFDYWQYSEPMNADYREPESYWYDLLIETDTDTLIQVGNLFERYLNYLKFKGYEL